MIKKLTIYSIILMGIFFTLAGCGKDEKLEGNHYKAYVNGNFKADISFEKDEAKVISRNLYDGELLVKYEMKKQKDKTYLFIDSKDKIDFLKKSLMDLGDSKNPDNYGITVWQVVSKDDDIILKPVYVKTKEGTSSCYNVKLNLDDVFLENDEGKNEIRLRME